MELIPYFDQESNEIQDGDFLPLPNWCKKHFGRICLQHYESAKTKSGFSTCPYGFSTFTQEVGTTNVIFTGLMIRDHYLKKKVKPKIKAEENINEISETQFLKLREKSIDYNNKNYDLKSKLNELSLSIDRVRREKQYLLELTNNTLHEIRGLNKTLKSQAEDIIATQNRYVLQDDNDFFGFRIKNINATSNLISTRLSTFDLINNPDFIDTTPSRSICVHNKFYKTKQLLSTFFYTRKIKFELNGVSYSEIFASDLFEILPFIIYENFIKYSLEESKIVTEFHETNENIEVRIFGIGPILSEQESKLLFQNGFRGNNAKKMGVSGSGIGFYIAKIICDLYTINIDVKSSQIVQKMVDSIPFSSFEVYLTLPIHNKKCT